MRHLAPALRAVHASGVGDGVHGRDRVLVAVPVDHDDVVSVVVSEEPRLHAGV